MEDFAWRAPTPADWLDRCAALDAQVRALEGPGEAADAVGVELRRLAGCRLGAKEQMKLEAVSRRMLASGVTPAHYRRFRLGVLAARTLSFLVRPLAAAGPARGLLVDVVEAPYDQVGSFAFSPLDPFQGEALDAVLIVVDQASFPNTGVLLDGDAARARLAAAEALIAAAVAAVKAKVGCPAIVATVPESVDGVASADRGLVGTELHFIAGLNRSIAEGGARGEWIVWDMAALATGVGGDRWFDPVRYHQAKTVFAVELSPLVADHLCGLIAALCGKSGRAAVLDLDNTLWGGVIGDDGIDGIKLGRTSPVGEAHIALQTWLAGLRQRGVVLAVCSKNTDEIAREPFRSHPEMVLREDHIAVFQANWLDKATNIKTIAETLNLGLESLVFIDDNPAERARVRQELPLVCVPELGEDPALYVRALRRSGAFEHLMLNADDLGRAEAYGAEAKRAEIRERVGNYDDYLASLRMRMEIAPFDDLGRARIAQLISKSNQFNLTTRRYNEEDVRRMAADPDLLCWQVRLDDAFGQHGMIGVVIVRKGETAWAIDTWLQSCRVLARGVEEAIMNRLVETARAAGVGRVTGEYLPTARNGIVQDFYDRMGFARGAVGAGDAVAYSCDTAAYSPHAVQIEILMAS